MCKVAIFEDMKNNKKDQDLTICLILQKKHCNSIKEFSAFFLMESTDINQSIKKIIDVFFSWIQ